MSLVVGTNSYVSLADAETYFTGRLGADNWDAATDANKTKALIQATRQIDQLFVFQGWVSDLTQTLAWPRTGVYDDDNRTISGTEIPAQIEAATAELALFYFNGGNTSSTTQSSDLGGLAGVSVGAISVQFDSAAFAQSIASLASNTVPATVKDAIGSFGRLRNSGSGSIGRA